MGEVFREVSEWTRDGEAVFLNASWERNYLSDVCMAEGHSGVAAPLWTNLREGLLIEVTPTDMGDVGFQGGVDWEWGAVRAMEPFPLETPQGLITIELPEMRFFEGHLDLESREDGRWRFPVRQEVCTDAGCSWEVLAEIEVRIARRFLPLDFTGGAEPPLAAGLRLLREHRDGKPLQLGNGSLGFGVAECPECERWERDRWKRRAAADPHYPGVFRPSSEAS